MANTEGCELPSEPKVRSSELVSPLACPFCGVEAKEHDGDYVLGHANECFFSQHYAQEMWLVGKRKVRIWNKRPNDPKLSRADGNQAPPANGGAK